VVGSGTTKDFVVGSGGGYRKLIGFDSLCMCRLVVRFSPNSEHLPPHRSKGPKSGSEGPKSGPEGPKSGSEGPKSGSSSSGFWTVPSWTDRT
jgi:hypothetical protein